MKIKLLATALLPLFLMACGPSPWSDYRKENKAKQNPLFEKVQGTCEYEWVQGPFHGKKSEFNFTYSENLNELPIVELWMPTMGHGSAPTKVTPMDGYYNVQNVYFIMGGLWEVRLKTSDGNFCSFQIEIQ